MKKLIAHIYFVSFLVHAVENKLIDLFLNINVVTVAADRMCQQYNRQ